MSLAQRVIERRKELGLSQRKLAEAVGISQSAINKVEHGDTRNPGFIFELAQALQTDPLWLREGITREEISISLEDDVIAQAELPERYKESGSPLINLLVTARVGTDPDRLFRYRIEGDLHMLYLTDVTGTLLHPYHYIPDGEWDTGKVVTDGQTRSCRITGVVRSLIIPCNQHVG